MRAPSPLAVAIGVAVALGVTGYVRASSQAQEQRMWDFVKKAGEERKRLGIKDYAAATAQFPTPEVRFTRRPPAACPGQKLTVEARGKLPAGAGVFVLSDAVTVSREKLTTTSWQADVTVDEDALPEAVDVRVVSPVSGSYETLRVLDIACAYRWALTLEGGETLTVTTDWKSDAVVRAQGEWSRGGGQPTPAEVEVRRAGDGRFTFRRLGTSEEAQAQVEGMSDAMNSPEWAKLEERLQVEMGKFEACQKKPPAEMGKCMKGPADEIQKISQERNELMTRGRDTGAARAGLPAKAGCEEIEVQAARGGKLTGKGDGCVQPATQKVTGTVAAIR